MQIRAAHWSPAVKLAGFAVAAGLVGGLACGTAATWIKRDPAAAEEVRVEKPKPVEKLGGGLDQLGVRPAVQIGTAVQSKALQDDARYRGVLTREFSSLTPENALKWDILEPARGQYDWKNADAIVNFAGANHQSVRGHTLVWYY